MTVREQGKPAAGLPGGVVALVATLILFYMVSQFLRNSIGVIAPDLAAELGMSASEIGVLSSVFFLVFASAQLPLGVALDRFGPRRCMLACAGIAVVGAIVFAQAHTPTGLIVGRILLGLGSSSSFMAPLALYAKRFPPERFATLTGLQLGLGSFGTLFATAPLAWASAAFGWRSSFLAVGLLSAMIAVLVWWVVREENAPSHTPVRPETWRENLKGILEAMRIPGFGPLFLMHLTAYSSFALVVGLWGGPYLTHIYGFGLKERGDLLLLAAVAQIVGSMLWGTTDRLFGNHKVPVVFGALATATMLGLVAMIGTFSGPALIVWLVVFGASCAYTPVLIAHGRSLFPPHLVGRGITLLNMGTIGGVFVAQTVSGVVIDFFPKGADGAYALEAYRVVFGLQSAAIALGCLAYFRTPDPRARRP
jgi:MFS family permease